MLFNGARRGFTLLEVLMAVGIFAFAAIGLLIALEGTLDGARLTQREAEVRQGLANRMARLSVGPIRPVNDKDVENGVTYTVRVEREEVTNASETLLRGFWRFTARAEWSTSSGPQDWTISHLVYRND